MNIKRELQMMSISDLKAVCRELGVSCPKIKSNIIKQLLFPLKRQYKMRKKSKTRDKRKKSKICPICLDNFNSKYMIDIHLKNKSPVAVDSKGNKVSHLLCRKCANKEYTNCPICRQSFVKPPWWKNKLEFQELINIRLNGAKISRSENNRIRWKACCSKCDSGFCSKITGCGRKTCYPCISRNSSVMNRMQSKINCKTGLKALNIIKDNIDLNR